MGGEQEGDRPARGASGLEAGESANWRETLLHVLLLSAAALGTIAFPAIAWFAVTRAHPGWLSFLAMLYAMIVGAAAAPRLKFSLRASALLVGLGTLGVLGFLRVGFQSGPGIGSALVVVIAGLLLGRGALLATFGLTQISILCIGVYQTETHASFMAAGINDPTLFRNWLRVAIVYGLFTGVLATAVMFVLTRIERALAQRTDALEYLRSANSQRREAESALDDAQRTILQMQKMEAIGRLAGGVAHDFNNALVVILGWADLLRSKPDDAARVQEGLNEIVAAGNRAAGLTRQLLAFARKSVLLPRAIDLYVLIGELRGMLVRLLPANIRLTTVVPDDLPCVLADPTQIHQALLNLCVNARDAMPAGGTLEISAGLRQTAGAPGLPPGSWVELSVRDSGVGMDAATQAQAFEPFFTTKGELGTGLGLSSVYGIVQQNQGHVRLESAPGNGTTITLLLPPCSMDPAHTDAARPSLPPMAAARTILIAEHEATARALMQETLSAAGYRVVTAENAAAALELTRRYRGKIDLLIAAADMPGMSSATLITDFRMLFPTARVMVSAGEEEAASLELVQHEAIHLNRPFSAAGLLRLMTEVFPANGGPLATQPVAADASQTVRSSAAAVYEPLASSEPAQTALKRR